MSKQGYMGFTLQVVLSITRDEDRAILLWGGRGGELISLLDFESGMSDALEGAEELNIYADWLGGGMYSEN